MKLIHSSAFCQNCGENVSEEVAFCRSCGTALSEEQVRANIHRSPKGNSIHLDIQDKNTPFVQKIAGAVFIGFLETFFVVSVFVVSLIISMNFIPSFGAHSSGSLFTYSIIMITACIAGLVGGSALSKKLCKKYPEKVSALKAFLCLKEEHASPSGTSR